MLRHALILCVLLALGMGALAQQPQVFINEYCNDPLGPAGGLDTNGDGVVPTGPAQSDDEFVEIVNGTSGTVNISGWTLADGFSTRHTFAPGTMMPPGSAIVVFGGGSVTAFNASGKAGVLADTGSLGLNNGGDTITLSDQNGNPIDIQTYVSGGPGDGDGESITRCPEAPGGTFTRHTVATMGVFHSAGLLKDGSTLYPPATLPPPQMPQYPGNGSDARIFVRVNGAVSSPIIGVHNVLSGDLISLQFGSENGTLDGTPFLAFGQLFATGAVPGGVLIPGDTMGPVIFDQTAPVYVIFDGLSAPLSLFAPVLGFTELNFVVPVTLNGMGQSIVVVCLAQPDPGVPNTFMLGNAPAQELIVQ